MSDDDTFALPPFKPADALVLLQRALRDVRPLVQRQAEFTWKGQVVINLNATDTALTARLAKRPARVPEWDTSTLASSADVRKFTDEVKKRVGRWGDDTR